MHDRQLGGPGIAEHFHDTLVPEDGEKGVAAGDGVGGFGVGEGSVGHGVLQFGAE